MLYTSLLHLQLYGYWTRTCLSHKSVNINWGLCYFSHLTELLKYWRIKVKTWHSTTGPVLLYKWHSAIALNIQVHSTQDISCYNENKSPPKYSTVDIINSLKLLFSFICLSLSLWGPQYILLARRQIIPTSLHSTLRTPLFSLVLQNRQLELHSWCRHLHLCGH